jgi:hypothetical protein
LGEGGARYLEQIIFEINYQSGYVAVISFFVLALVVGSPFWPSPSLERPQIVAEAEAQEGAHHTGSPSHNDGSGPSQARRLSSSCPPSDLSLYICSAACQYPSSHN